MLYAQGSDNLTCMHAYINSFIKGWSLRAEALPELSAKNKQGCVESIKQCKYIEDLD